MAHIDHELQRLERDAIRTASRDGVPVAIYNLNSAGRRLLVIRQYDDGPPPYAGPFQPCPKWQAEFPDYPADAIPALGEGWTDQSWHNDACPSFIHDESGVVIWCDYPTPADRELGRFASHYNVVQVATRDPLHGWQYGDGDSDVLRCDTLGELRDWLDSIPYCKSVADALQSARMRLNQLTTVDARELLANELRFGADGGKACPDLIGAMREMLERAPDGITLDGERARLRFMGKFGFVSRADGRGGDVEFALATIANVLASGGAFKS